MICAACGRSLEAQEALAFWVWRFGATPPPYAVSFVCRPLRSAGIPCFARAVHERGVHVVAEVVETASGRAYRVHPDQIEASPALGGTPAQPRGCGSRDARGEVASQPRTLATSPETVDAFWAARELAGVAR